MKTETKGENIPNIVIPTIRSKEHFETFLKAWEEEFIGCHIIIIEDRTNKQLNELMSKYVDNFTIYDHKDIDKDLGENSWIIPRKTDCVRSYGYYKAWQNKPLFIVTLDDDVEPQLKHIETFYKKLFLEEYNDDRFYNTLKSNLPRGTYKGQTGCDVVHGGWTNVPDLSAEEQIKNMFTSTSEDFNTGLIPTNIYFSMCGMNLAWKPHVTKDIYFGLQGGEYPIDRCGDIWAGYNITKRGYSVYTGYPFCKHTRASNVWSNLKKEGNAERMSKYCMDFFPVIPDGMDVFLIPYWSKLKEAYKIWEELFK